MHKGTFCPVHIVVVDKIGISVKELSYLSEKNLKKKIVIKR